MAYQPYVHAPGDNGAAYLASLAARKAPRPSVKPPVTTTAPTRPGTRPQTMSQQAQAQANVLFAPLLKQLQDSISARSTQGQNAITGYSSQLASLLHGFAPQAQAGYQQAQSNTAAANAALSAELKGAGSDVAASLAGRLQAAGADPGLAQSQAQIGQGSAGALYGSGTADLNRLISQGVNAQDYYNKQPGIAVAQGLQQSRGLQGQLSQELATGLAGLQAKQPQAYLDILSGLQDSAAKAQSNRIAQAATEAELGLKRGSLDVSKYNAQTSRINAATTRENAITSRQTAAAKLNAPNSSLSKMYGYVVNSKGEAISGADGLKQKLPGSGSGRKANSSLSKALGYVVDNAGEAILRNGKRVTLPKSTSGKGPLGLSGKDYTVYSAKSLGAARTYHQEWTDADGKKRPPLTWQQYLTHGEAAGFPIALLVKQGKKVYSAKERKLGLIPGAAGG